MADVPLLRLPAQSGDEAERATPILSHFGALSGEMSEGKAYYPVVASPSLSSFPEQDSPALGFRQLEAATSSNPQAVSQYDAKEYPKDHRPTFDRVQSLASNQAAQEALLIAAAGQNQLSQLKDLLQSGISPDIADYGKRSALHVACAEGHEDAVALLLENGASINARDRAGNTPLDDAVRSKNESLVKFLISKGAELSKEGSETSLIQMAARNDKNDVPLARLMLEAKADANCGDYDGRTPLHLAVCESNVALAELLLAFGADPYKEDRWQTTPIMECTRHANRTGTNEMSRLFLAKGFHQEQEESAWSIFTVLFALIQIAIIVLMFAATTYSEGAAGGDEALTKANMATYPYFQDVNVMVFLGFGFLMAFLRKNTFNSVGLTFMIATMCIEWYMLVNGFFSQAFCAYQHGHNVCNENWHKIPLGLDAMLVAEFCAASVLITYGALLGKLTPAQLCVMAFFEVIFYAINEQFGKALQITDIGGTLVIHMFGAYFGMALSIALRSKYTNSHALNSSVYHSDAFAMIGTIFLFMYWPSFNAAPSLNEAQRERTALNTFLSIIASTFCAFLASRVLRREEKFNMVDVQNATLAGGVAMGASADLLITPGAAVAIGSIAGTVSVLGYVYVQGFLERKLGYHDTCGVNNLHGMPSIIGALACIIASGLATQSAYGQTQLAVPFSSVASGARTPGQQAGFQAAYIAVTLGWALLSGYVTGSVLKRCLLMRMPQSNFFTDDGDWEVPLLETPYYYDRRGEIERAAPTNKSTDEPSIALNERLNDLEKRLAALKKAGIDVSRTQQQSVEAPMTNDIEKVLVQMLKEVQARKPEP